MNIANQKTCPLPPLCPMTTKVCDTKMHVGHLNQSLQKRKIPALTRTRVLKDPRNIILVEELDEFGTSCKTSITQSNLCSIFLTQPWNPKGNLGARKTLVRSLARLNDEQGRAIIKAMILPCLISSSILKITAGFVRSLSSPFSNSHSRAEKPKLLTARETPPAPANKSATYRPLIEFKVEECLGKAGLA